MFPASIRMVLCMYMLGYVFGPSGVCRSVKCEVGVQPHLSPEGRTFAPVLFI